MRLPCVVGQREKSESDRHLLAGLAEQTLAGLLSTFLGNGATAHEQTGWAGRRDLASPLVPRSGFSNGVRGDRVAERITEREIAAERTVLGGEDNRCPLRNQMGVQSSASTPLEPEQLAALLLRLADALR